MKALGFETLEQISESTWEQYESFIKLFFERMSFEDRKPRENVGWNDRCF